MIRAIKQPNDGQRDGHASVERHHHHDGQAPGGHRYEVVGWPCHGGRWTSVLEGKADVSVARPDFPGFVKRDVARWLRVEHICCRLFRLAVP